MRLSKKWIAGTLAFVLILSATIAGCAMGKDNKEEEQTAGAMEFQPLDTTSKKVVAEYKGGKVVEGDLNRYINIIAYLDPQLSFMMSSIKDNQELKTELAKEYAARQYMLTKIKDDASFAKQADETIKQIEEGLKQQAGQEQGQNNPQTLDEAIKGKGFDKTQLRQFFVEYHRVNKYYDEQLKGQTYDYVKVQHVLVSINDGSQQDQPKRTEEQAKKRAEEVKKKLDDGGDFAKLVKEYSDDPGSKDSNGVYEGTPDQFVPEFAKACRELPLNQISDPIKTDYGFHIVKVLDRGKKPVDEADEQVKMQKRQEVYDQLVKEELGFKSLLSNDQKGS